MTKLILIAAFGALGTLARYGLAGWVQRWGGAGFPWGTLAVNLAGCFLFALVWAWAEDRLWVDGQWRLAALTGFMGAFTTMSTFMFETGGLLRDGQFVLALVNVAAQNLGGLAALVLGYLLGRWL